MQLGTLEILFIINYSIAFLLLLQMIFFSKKKFERIAAWAFTLLIPFLGLVIYLLIGAGLNGKTKRMLRKKSLSNKRYNQYLQEQIEQIKNDKNSMSNLSPHRELVLLNLNNANSILTQNNQVEYLNDGDTFANRLIDDIKNAKHHIHLQFYIFANDKIGKQIKHELIKKAEQGVEVRVLYDSIGSMFTTKFSFRKLKKAGGKIAEFFPPFLKIKILNVYANYRNHRKIVVIDGKIGYTGGTNIRDDHLGRKQRLSPWRDTNVRIQGGAVTALQNLFLSDWRYSINDKHDTNFYLTKDYFPSFDNGGGVAMQVIASGPDNSNESIKECMVKMIVSAKNSIKIQTPYFIPDDTVMGSLKLAILSGVKVEIMVPKKIDHVSVHYASMGYINDLMALGATVHIYNGFIHSKVLIADDKYLTLGSCNMDIRSFSLNFENNVVIYDKQKVLEYINQFNKDTFLCREYTEKDRKSKNIFVKMFVSICRLFSAIL